MDEPLFLFLFVHCTFNNFNQTLNRTKQTQATHSDFYKMSFNKCDKYTQDKQENHLKTRYKDHLPHSNSTKTTSPIAEHIINNDRTYRNIENNLKILHILNKRRPMNILE